jgi:hypothetical protein
MYESYDIGKIVNPAVLSISKARSVTNILWYYFEVLFSGGSRNSTYPKTAFVTERKKSA